MPIVTGAAKATGGGSTLLFSSTLGGAAASIDTGAGGVAGTASILEIFFVGRTTEAVINSTVLFTFNNDSGANYDKQLVAGVNVSAVGALTLGSASFILGCAGASAAANNPAAITLTFPMYAATVFNKFGQALSMETEAVGAASTNQALVYALGWRSNAAISRVKVAAGSGNLVTGSSLLIYGR